jgi:hypothetical protein
VIPALAIILVVVAWDRPDPGLLLYVAHVVATLWALDRIADRAGRSR